MIRPFRSLSLAALFAVLGLFASAATLEVGSGKTYTDIQSAIDAAKDGDEVLVYDGAYGSAAQLNVTKGVTLRSVNGRDKTFILRTDRPDLTKQAATDAGCVYRVLSINNADARVEGFSISGGYVSKTAGEHGAGVCIGTDGGVLCDCVVSNNLNRQASYGGGVAILSASGVVTNCLVTQNISIRVSAAEGDTFGCGVYLAAGILTHSEITNNNRYYKTVASQGGPGMHGAGVYLNDGRVSHCRISGNWMGNGGNIGKGGGVYAVNGIIDNSLIDNNKAAGNNTGNPAVSGGGVFVESASDKVVSLINCTIVDNSAPNMGGVYSQNSTRLVNTVIFGNTATQAVDPEFRSASQAIMSNCLSSATFSLPKYQFDCQTVQDAKLDGDYRPASDSSCVDFGWDGVLSAISDTDFSGGKRKDGLSIDIGCYEFQVPTFNVSVTFSYEAQIPGSVIGCTAIVQTVSAAARSYRWKIDDGAWSDYSSDDGIETSFETSGNHTVQVQVKLGEEPQQAVSTVFYVAPAIITVATDGTGEYSDIPSALSAAGDGSTVRMKAGTYDFSGEQTISKAVTLVGIEGAVTTVLHRTDGSMVSGEANRVLTINNSRAVVRGVTVSGGCIYDAEDEHGAGVCIGAKGGHLADSIVSCNTNRAHSYGAGVALLGENAVVTNCQIRENCLIRKSSSEESRGGGVYLARGLVIDSEISFNSGDGCLGMGVCVTGGRLSRNRICSNKMNTSNVGAGAGVYATGSDTLVDNCLVCCNTNNDTQAGGKGGGVYLQSGAVLVNCTVVSNFSINVGGIYADKGVVANGIIQDNGLLQTTKAATIAETNWYGSATCTYSISSDPLPVGDGNVLGAAVLVPGTFQVKAHQPGWKAGSSSKYETYVGPIVSARDLHGESRSNKTRKHIPLLDMGCCESPWIGPGLLLLLK